ncbi:ABC transporter substrate-binding protein [Novosphingobium profundi]|uniref:ABC transporter substrate-binding protein n=1 Tax=Novosphingobium profundi TaxID=1774954 RepID=UPI001BD9549C|nr:ABC transporter substrate-binding protein [Novosphingobium profundi]MBT0669110.1 ABC transporter substrate-binding protein [Novosphingobium profundi]
MSETIRVGVLNDMADPLGLDEAAPEEADIGFWLERETRRLHAAGRLRAPVEIVHAYALGLPTGTSEAVERAYHQLVDAQASLIVGPFLADNAMILAPLAESLRVPTLMCSNEERARSRHGFQLQSGSPEDEAALMMRQLARLGCTRIAVIHEASRQGERMVKCLRSEGAAVGGELIARVPLEASALAPEDLDAALATAFAERPDGCIFIVHGKPPAELAQAVMRAGFTGPCFLNLGTTPEEGCELPADFAGWFQVALTSPGNATLAHLLAEHPIATRHRAAIARAYDLARLVAEGLARAPTPGTSGARLGLEQVRALPAAQGEDGTLLGFGVHDRGALHGAYLTIRKCPCEAPPA